ncbi:hypothetical protein NFX46_21195 [Streptomyces phaeoluteigriseus]|uniref:TIGR04222 domain-containing membrane protein n=2 Tax=Streptomyces phaeoluteigriseus TaxID=114686 RepID=A0ABY4ZAL5_9ACTN|nr:hypothetical protein [Streptomyces phaeoluteigriseus]USQ86011.1 hypothetical protein NFX46_21195 [Streptomyces phaeoluteigriseus]
MSQVDLVLAVLVAFGVVYAVLGVLWWIRDRADRAVVARVDGAHVDPYHAVATVDGYQGADRAAAAELLLTDLIRIEEDGQVAVTDQGADTARTPEHPVPAAVLATLRGHAGPWPLNWLYVDAEHCRRRDPFLRTEDARWPRWSGHAEDRLQIAAILVAALLAGWLAAQLMYATGAFSANAAEILVGVIAGLLTWGVFALVPHVVVMTVWPERRDRFAEYCRGLLPHPAEAALDAARRERLGRAMAYRRPSEPDRWPLDTPGAF